MTDIQDRLDATTKACMEAYKAWDSKKSDIDLRENLQEAVHDLRKVASRLEIEMAVSERADMTDKPLPIPPHKSSRKAKNGNANGNGNQNDNAGNAIAAAGEAAPKSGARRGGRGRKPAAKSAE